MCLKRLPTVIIVGVLLLECCHICCARGRRQPLRRRPRPHRDDEHGHDDHSDEDEDHGHEHGHGDEDEHRGPSANFWHRKDNTGRIVGHESHEGHDEHEDHHWMEVHRNNRWHTPEVRVFLWPNLTPHEKKIMRSAFQEFRKKTCIKFLEEEWVPWFHWKRWELERPYIIVRKSKHLHLLAESKLDLKLNRTLMYVSEGALNQDKDELSRGIALHELTHILGMPHEHQRPDADLYIKVKSPNNKLRRDTHKHSHVDEAPEVLQWPFDPMSVTIYHPKESDDFFYTMTNRCPGITEEDIAKGKRLGFLTFWDAVKANAMYCPDKIPANARSTPSPCKDSRFGRRARQLGQRQQRARGTRSRA